MPGRRAKGQGAILEAGRRSVNVSGAALRRLGRNRIFASAETTEERASRPARRSRSEPLQLLNVLAVCRILTSPKRVER